MQYIGSSLIPDLIGNTIAAVFFLSGSYAFIYGMADQLMHIIKALHNCSSSARAQFYHAIVLSKFVCRDSEWPRLQPLLPHDRQPSPRMPCFCQVGV